MYNFATARERVRLCHARLASMCAHSNRREWKASPEISPVVSLWGLHFCDDVETGVFLGSCRTNIFRFLFPSLQRTARINLEWSQSDSERLTRGTRYSNWKRNSITIGTWRGDDGSRSLILWSCRRDRSKSGFRTVEWNGRRTTSCRTQRTCAKKIRTGRHRQRRRNQRRPRRRERSPAPVITTAKGKTTITPRPAVWRAVSIRVSATIWTRFMGSPRVFLTPLVWYIRAFKVTLILWLISKRSWVIITWVEWWTDQREDRWDT